LSVSNLDFLFEKANEIFVDEIWKRKIFRFEKIFKEGAGWFLTKESGRNSKIAKNPRSLKKTSVSNKGKIKVAINSGG